MVYKKGWCIKKKKKKSLLVVSPSVNNTKSLSHNYFGGVHSCKVTTGRVVSECRRLALEIYNALEDFMTLLFAYRRLELDED